MFILTAYIKISGLFGKQRMVWKKIILPVLRLTKEGFPQRKNTAPRQANSK
jgi:hypothetical protein